VRKPLVGAGAVHVPGIEPRTLKGVWLRTPSALIPQHLFCSGVSQRGGPHTSASRAVSALTPILLQGDGTTSAGGTRL